MTRPALLASAPTIVALLVAAPVTAAPVAGTDAPPTYIKFELPANHGMHAKLEAADGEVTLEIWRKGRSVSYEVSGEASEAGLKVRFGKLGLIDVAFEPTKTLRVKEPPKGCKGEPATHREGNFAGTIAFTGERRFVRIEAAQVTGKMSVYRESEWRCPGPKRPIRTAPRQAESEFEPATLSAFDRRCGCYFLALAESDGRWRGRSYFLGARFERGEGMEIVRETRAGARAGAFRFDHVAGTAQVRPPQPFSGHGTFERRQHGRDLWRSTIRVPVLGAAPFTAGGRAFRGRLVRDLPGD